VAANYEVTDAMLNEFKQLVQQSPLRFDEAAWQKDRPYIVAMMAKEIDLDIFGANKAYERLAKQDPQLQFALNYFGEAASLLNISKSSNSSRAARN
jgi:hypothetical protein